MSRIVISDTKPYLDIVDERARQDRKWGQQNHPNGTARPGARLLADYYRAVCQANGPLEDNWQDILLEEVFEALAEDEWPVLRRELVQAAAVIVQWIECGDRGEQEPAGAS